MNKLTSKILLTTSCLFVLGIIFNVINNNPNQVVSDLKEKTEYGVSVIEEKQVIDQPKEFKVDPLARSELESIEDRKSFVERLKEDFQNDFPQFKDYVTHREKAILSNEEKPVKQQYLSNEDLFFHALSEIKKSSYVDPAREAVKHFYLTSFAREFIYLHAYRENTINMVEDVLVDFEFREYDHDSMMFTVSSMVDLFNILEFIDQEEAKAVAGKIPKDNVLYSLISKKQI